MLISHLIDCIFTITFNGLIVSRFVIKLQIKWNKNSKTKSTQQVDTHHVQRVIANANIMNLTLN